MSNPPATPQRATKPSHHHSHSVAQSHFRSPLSPSSPYTPLSLRSFSSSTNPSPSILTTPGSFRASSVLTSPPPLKKITFHSPQATRLSSGHHEKGASVADVAPNWRCRASVNGIRVSASAEDSYLDDYDVSLSEDHSIANEEALLPPPFLSTQRRRALSQSHAGNPNPPVPSVTNAFRTPSARPAPPSSPVVRKTLSNLNSVTATPPPKRNLAQQLKLKGSQTDPPHTRRREAFGIVHTPSQNIPRNNDTSFDLFDIDENDYEFEYQAQENAYTNQQSLFFDQDEYELELEYPSIPVSRSSVQHPPASSEYSTYPPGLGLDRHATAHVTTSAHMLPLFGQPTFADPGITNSGHPADSVERYWSQYHQQPQYNAYTDFTHSNPANPALHHQTQLRHAPSVHQGLRVPSSASSTYHRSSNSPCPSHDSYHSTEIGRAPLALPTPRSISAVSRDDTSTEDQKPTSCSVCSRTQLARLAILSPCGHPLCSSCLTSALNIVGEKDMTCVVAKCGKAVEDFTLVSVNSNPGTIMDFSSSMSTKVDKEDEGAKDFAAGLDSAFDFTEVDFDLPSDVEQEFDLQDGFGMRASTPPPALTRTKNSTSCSESTKTKSFKSKEAVVLRIDNVPWDITPPRISAWLQQPIERVHVLLDRKGKTMSHAYVEVMGEEIAGAILRGEIQSKVSSQKMRGSILGKGRRARGVTLTRSCQEELMAALFPAWQGTFDGARPSLGGLTSDRVITTLENGLMTEGEVRSLLYLIRSPDAHFLKVPSLPFYVLLSVLRKFPADVDSRVFWSANLRDVLFDMALAAVQVLALRVEGNAEKEQSQQDVQYAPELVEELIESILLCQAFTSEQIQKIQSFLDSSRRSGSPGSQAESVDASESFSVSEEKSLLASGQDGSDADIEDEGSDSAESDPQANSDKDDDEVRTPSSATVASRDSIQNDSVLTAHDDVPSQGEATSDAVDVTDLAREFGVEAQLVQALAARLAELRQA
ncbi:hypothetical protein D9758_002804 [Tetrapyrgos nigripes]|uniref:RING-type domain-containing protein n=1 Tax=Tetrapyrgos nigripes TaxID=182062 RepID=A0A8H5GQB8_9AGAR|nr:hypothetical protein D9758_002804 [Tetrapyrgos nigripes]